MAKKSVATPQQRRALFRAMVVDLQRERKELLARLAAVESELAGYGAPPAAAAPRKATAAKAARAGAKRPARAGAKAGAKAPREGSLKAYIIAALGKQPMAPAQISEAVMAAGYKSTSKHMPQRVAVACSEMVRSQQIGKKGRGKYVSG